MVRLASVLGSRTWAPKGRVGDVRWNSGERADTTKAGGVRNISAAADAYGTVRSALLFGSAVRARRYEPSTIQGESKAPQSAQKAQRSRMVGCCGRWWAQKDMKVSGAQRPS
ncbi:hypothetical protein NDU88_004748 [Pleurodeles waltl]|uniref:Uncharacterized protein n=1 Tax=Pleurodeles waltl TaxID=8319 RepID=A0AAV7LJM2_PLEWA|nr:hypothetical protein NDU88_004748 [Pleurodeles waltl]